MAADSLIPQPHQQLPDDERLIQCAFVEGLHDQAYCFWSHKVPTWLQLQSTALNIDDEICVSTVVDNAKTLYTRLFTRLFTRLAIA